MKVQRLVCTFTVLTAILLADPVQRAEADSSELAGKLHETLSRLCLAVERAYQEEGLTRDDVNVAWWLKRPLGRYTASAFSLRETEPGGGYHIVAAPAAAQEK